MVLALTLESMYLSLKEGTKLYSIVSTHASLFKVIVRLFLVPHHTLPLQFFLYMTIHYRSCVILENLLRHHVIP